MTTERKVYTVWITKRIFTEGILQRTTYDDPAMAKLVRVIGEKYGVYHHVHCFADRASAVRHALKLTEARQRTLTKQLEKLNTLHSRLSEEIT